MRHTRLFWMCFVAGGLSLGLSIWIPATLSTRHRLDDVFPVDSTNQLREIDLAIRQYVSENHTYPASLIDLNGVIITSAAGRYPYRADFAVEDRRLRFLSDSVPIAYIDHRSDVIVAYELDPLKPVCMALYGNGDIREISPADLRNQTVPAKATR